MRLLSSFLIGLVVLLALVGNAHADLQNPFSEAAVIETINNYMQDLNLLAMYGGCDASKLSPNLAPFAASLVNKYFSPDVRSYRVIQRLNPDVIKYVAVNFTVGAVDSTNGQNNGAIAQLPTSAALVQLLGFFYAGFASGSYLSNPFMWMLSAPVVHSINLNDRSYSGDNHKITARFSANNRNEGFLCDGHGNRVGWQVGMNQYVHVLEYNHQTDSWQYLEFLEYMGGNALDQSQWTQLQP